MFGAMQFVNIANLFPITINHLLQSISTSQCIFSLYTYAEHSQTKNASLLSKFTNKQKQNRNERRSWYLIKNVNVRIKTTYLWYFQPRCRFVVVALFIETIECERKQKIHSQKHHLFMIFFLRRHHHILRLLISLFHFFCIFVFISKFIFALFP